MKDNNFNEKIIEERNMNSREGYESKKAENDANDMNNSLIDSKIPMKVIVGKIREMDAHNENFHLDYDTMKKNLEEYTQNSINPAIIELKQNMLYHGEQLKKLFEENAYLKSTLHDFIEDHNRLVEANSKHEVLVQNLNERLCFLEHKKPMEHLFEEKTIKKEFTDPFKAENFRAIEKPKIPDTGKNNNLINYFQQFNGNKGKNKKASDDKDESPSFNDNNGKIYILDATLSNKISFLKKTEITDDDLENKYKCTFIKDKGDLGYTYTISAKKHSFDFEKFLKPKLERLSRKFNPEKAVKEGRFETFYTIMAQDEQIVVTPHSNTDIARKRYNDIFFWRDGSYLYYNVKKAEAVKNEKRKNNNFTQSKHYEKGKFNKQNTNQTKPNRSNDLIVGLRNLLDNIDKKKPSPNNNRQKGF